MKIILLQDVPKLGKKWEVKEVSIGFARNHLFPRRLAKAATPAAVAMLEQKITQDAIEAEQELRETQELASRLDGLEVEIPTKLTDKGVSYSSISAQTIADALAALGFRIDKSAIRLAEPIKKIGEYPVTIALKHRLEVEINVLVIDEAERRELTE